MSTAVYNVISLLVQDQGRQMQFHVRYNVQTQSIRLESAFLKRSIFIGRRLFSNLFQFMSNEYGCKLGQILYNTTTYSSGTAIIFNNEHYHFLLYEENGIRVSLQSDAADRPAITALVQPGHTVMNERSFVKTLIPALLGIVIYALEAVV